MLIHYNATVGTTAIVIPPFVGLGPCGPTMIDEIKIAVAHYYCNTRVCSLQLLEST